MSRDSKRRRVREMVMDAPACRCVVRPSNLHVGQFDRYIQRRLLLLLLLLLLCVHRQVSGSLQRAARRRSALRTLPDLGATWPGLK